MKPSLSPEAEGLSASEIPHIFGNPSSNGSTFQLFKNVFITFVVKTAVAGWSSETFYLD
jgi:hypothetical protein